jgi:hypothetical protein
VTRQVARNAERWLLWRIPANPTQRALVDAWAIKVGHLGVPEPGHHVAVDMGLRRLKAKGLAEKHRPPGLNRSAKWHWRLTAAGELELERRELVAAQHRHDHDQVDA